MTHFDHLLNAFEQASQADNPAKEGYAEKRRALLAYVRELESYKQDAERYRWLRNRIPGSAYRIAGIIYSEGGAGVDAGIDAARKGEGGGVLRFIVKRHEMVFDAGIDRTDYCTLDIDCEELEAILQRGGKGPGGFESWSLVGVEIISIKGEEA